MNNIQLYIALIVLGWLGSYLVEWWFLSPLALLLGLLINRSKFPPFVPGFLAGFSLWGFMVAYQIGCNFEVPAIVTTATLLNVSPILLLIIISSTGGLLAGLGVSCGYFLKRVVLSS
jgi:hypothetical protein